MDAHVLDVIRSRAKALTINRPGAATVADGYMGDAAATAIPVQAVVQPMQPRELRNMPEGQSALSWLVLWSESELRVRDQFDRGGQTYTIQRIEDWSDDGGFYRAAAADVVEVLA